MTKSILVPALLFSFYQQYSAFSHALSEHLTGYHKHIPSGHGLFAQETVLCFATQRFAECIGELLKGL